jgi:predicted enzyme related to lactoylglutathione lyase
VKITRTVVVLDAPDLHAESTFWAGVLGGQVEVDDDDDWHSIIVDGEWRMGVQLALDHVPPVWPGGPQRQQVHLDLWVEDLPEAHERVLSLGGRLLQDSLDPSAREQFQVYADPAGHPFCLCWAVAADD